MAVDPEVLAFLDDVPVGVLATARPDGGIRQSLAYFARDGETVLISTVAKRGKARDVERTGRASFCVTGPAKPYPSVTVEGTASIRRTAVGEPTARIIGRISGEPPGEQLTDEALAAVDRVILELTIERAYGASYLPGVG